MCPYLLGHPVYWVTKRCIQKSDPYKRRFALLRRHVISEPKQAAASTPQKVPFLDHGELGVI